MRAIVKIMMEQATHNYVGESLSFLDLLDVTSELMQEKMFTSVLRSGVALGALSHQYDAQSIRISFG
jgi:hypothetical protein